MYNDLASSLLGRCVKARCWLPEKREKGRKKRNNSGWISLSVRGPVGEREREESTKAEERQK